VHFPAQLLGLNENTTPAARALVGALTGSMAAVRDLRGPQAAVYGTSKGPAVAVSAARFSTAAVRTAAADPATFDKGFALGFAKSSGITDLRSFPAGPHGGVLDCGHESGNGVIGCGWADKMRGGGVFYLRGSASSLSDASSKTNQIRAAIEP
jgi:hypothetical protein